MFTLSIWRCREVPYKNKGDTQKGIISILKEMWNTFIPYEIHYKIVKGLWNATKFQLDL